MKKSKMENKEKEEKPKSKPVSKASIEAAKAVRKKVIAENEIVKK